MVLKLNRLNFVLISDDFRGYRCLKKTRAARLLNTSKAIKEP